MRPYFLDQELVLYTIITADRQRQRFMKASWVTEYSSICGKDLFIVFQLQFSCTTKHFYVTIDGKLAETFNNTEDKINGRCLRPQNWQKNKTARPTNLETLSS